MRKALTALAAVMTSAIVFTATANADVSIGSFTVAPSSAQAGAHPDVTVDVQFASAGSDSVKDATISLAPGLIANPSAPAVCSAGAFQAEACPGSSQIGDGTITATAPMFGTQLNLPVGIFLLAPESSQELARIGVIANLDDFPVASISAPVRLRTSPSVGLDIPLTNIPNQVGGIDARIDEIRMRLFGTVNGSAFTRLPTSCAAADTGMTIDSYGAPSTQVTADASFMPTGCASLAYSPRLIPRAISDSGDNGVAFDASITQAAGEAATKDVALTLPSGLSPRLSAISSACTASDVSTCPSVGAATVTTPLVAQPIQGKLVLVAGSSGLPSLDAVLPPPFGLTLQGTPTIASGGVETSFSNIPDIPITRLEVDLGGGSSSLLTAGQGLCAQSQTVTGQFGAHSGANAHVSASVAVQGCPGPAGGAGGKPTLSRAKLSGLASGHPKLKAVFTNVSSFAIALPSGLSFRLRRHKGLSVGGAKLKSTTLKGGWLIVTLAKPASTVTVTVTGPLLNETRALERRVRHHKLKRLTLRFKLDGGAAFPRLLGV